MSRVLGLIDAIDRLYQLVIEDPAGVGEDDLAAWYADAMAAAPQDRELGRWVRRAVRLATRMGTYWSDPARSGSRPDDWRNGVDQAFGPRGWRPTLEIARRGLELDPSEELFVEMQRRFREVYFQPWLEMSFAEWQADRGDARTGPGP